MHLDGKETVCRPKPMSTRPWTTPGIASLSDLMGADPPARPVAVAPHRHDELTLFRRTAGQWPGHAHPEPLGLGRVPTASWYRGVVQSSTTRRTRHVSSSRACRIATGARRGPRSTRAGASTWSLEHTTDIPSRMIDCLEDRFRQEVNLRVPWSEAVLSVRG